MRGSQAWEYAWIHETSGARGGYKRVFDLTVMVITHLIFLPVWPLFWVLVPLAIKLEDGGPVFYRQTRLGLNGKPFRIVKFRSMIRNAESRTGPVWADSEDQRITKVGRVLRKTHMDEIPQFINVIKGEMSLVGPRPERPFLAEQITSEVPHFPRRLRVKPGITGLAQVRGKYATKPCHKLKYDLLYIDSMGPKADIKLILITSRVLFRRLFSVCS